jgi:uncharacterized protein
MKCPVCQVGLVMSERQTIEIDYCPKCRGVWLDRGELDKIIEYSFQQFAAPQEEVSEYRDEPGSGGGYADQGGYRGEEEYMGSRHGGKHGKHGRSGKHGGYSGGHSGRRGSQLSWLKDLFD